MYIIYYPTDIDPVPYRTLKSPLDSEEGSVNKCVLLHTAIERLSEIIGSDLLCGTEWDTDSPGGLQAGTGGPAAAAAAHAPGPALIFQHLRTQAVNQHTRNDTLHAAFFIAPQLTDVFIICWCNLVYLKV